VGVLVSLSAAESFYGELILPLPFSRICLLRTRL